MDMSRSREFWENLLYEKLTIPTIKKILRAKGLRVSGNKRVLIKRLLDTCWLEFDEVANLFPGDILKTVSAASGGSTVGNNNTILKSIVDSLSKEESDLDISTEDLELTETAYPYIYDMDYWTSILNMLREDEMKYLSKIAGLYVKGAKGELIEELLIYIEGSDPVGLTKLFPMDYLEQIMMRDPEGLGKAKNPELWGVPQNQQRSSTSIGLVNRKTCSGDLCHKKRHCEVLSLGSIQDINNELINIVEKLNYWISFNTNSNNVSAIRLKCFLSSRIKLKVISLGRLSRY